MMWFEIWFDFWHSMMCMPFRRETRQVLLLPKSGGWVSEQDFDAMMINTGRARPHRSSA